MTERETKGVLAQEGEVQEEMHHLRPATTRVVSSQRQQPGTPSSVMCVAAGAQTLGPSLAIRKRSLAGSRTGSGVARTQKVAF